MTATELRDPGFRAAVASEWSKFASLRSVRVALVLGTLLGIGATFEGVLRHHTIMPDGSNRDSAFYGVIAAEWPAVRARLEASLAR